MHGGCDDAYIHPDDLATDGGHDLSRPEHAKEPGDEGAREGLDLVQVDRAVVGELKAPEPPPDRRGRRPPVMAEEVRLATVSGSNRAVHLDEGVTLALGGGVNEASQDVSTDTGLATDQEGRPSVRTLSAGH